MCGIAGVIKDGINLTDKELHVISHRGIDDSGYCRYGKVWLGHQRLSIIDLSAKAHQPMTSSDENYVLIFNGEIYNHLEIRKKLSSKGVSFQSSSDTETLLHALIEYGTELFSMLNGIFALAFYNRIKEEIIIARDHFGVKPLYYYEQESCFMFSSELKFFTQFSFFNKDLQPEYFLNYLQFMYSPGGGTLFKHVKKLDPGSYIKYSVASGSTFITQYYAPVFSDGNETIEPDEKLWKEKLREHIVNSVERQLLSDAPLGFFLSGGLDSSLIVAVAKQVIGTSTRLQCYTIDGGEGMRKEGFADDLFYAQKVARYLNVELNIIPSSMGFIENFDKIIWHLDEPQADPAAMHVFNISSAAAASGIKVLLGGTAGDDVFSGYRRHQALRLERYYKLVPEKGMRLLSRISSSVGLNHPLLRRLHKLSNNTGASKHERMISYFSWERPFRLAQLLKRGLVHDISTEGEKYFLSALDRCSSNLSDLNKMLYLEMKGFLPDHNLNYTDKIGMAAGVEIRVPFLDIDLVNFACKLPTKLKMNGRTTKYLLRKLAEDYVPRDVVYRPKTGFGAPIRQWVRHDMRHFFQERLLDSPILTKDFFDGEAIRKMLDENKKEKTDSSFTILALAAIESWLRQFYY